MPMTAMVTVAVATRAVIVMLVPVGGMPSCFAHPVTTWVLATRGRF